MKNLAYLFTLFLLVSGCSLLPESNNKGDFGVLDDVVFRDGDKEVVLTRNRNYLVVQFADSLTSDEIEQLVSDHDLLFMNSNVDPTEYNYRSVLRVKRKPAEAYYTRYGGLDANAFGNSESVVFALPIFELPGGDKKFLTNELLVSFKESLGQARTQELLDSLMQADNLRTIESEWLGDLHLLQLNKSSTSSPIELSNHYNSQDFVTLSNPNFGLSIRR
ncbi:MAG: hypothetical protein JJU41_03750 [Bacteroidetes bacterium]|nr:hypothetical protein [Bacteroidota bacterium]